MKTFEEFHKNAKKETKLRRIDVDTSRLYGDVASAAKYLLEVAKEHPNYVLAEHWWGYEDMNMVFESYEEETDYEFDLRKKSEYSLYKKAIEDAEDRKKKEADRKKFLELKNKHGW